MEEIYACIEGQWTNDDAYAIAIEIEYCRVRNMSSSGGAADSGKCFDQFRREIVYKLMEEAGMPRGVLKTNKNSQEDLHARGTIA